MDDILDVAVERGQNGALISVISRQANLSHYAVVDKYERLIQVGSIAAKTIKAESLPLLRNVFNFIKNSKGFRT